MEDQNAYRGCHHPGSAEQSWRKKQGRFQRKKYQRAKGRVRGRSLLGSGSGQPGVRPVSVANRSGKDMEEGRRVTDKGA